MLQNQKSVKCYWGTPIHTLLKLMSCSKNYLRNIQLINCVFWEYNRLNIELRFSLWLECYNLRSVALWSRMLQRQMITKKFFLVFLPREIYRPTPLAPSCKNKHFECQCIWHEGSTFISQLFLRPWALVVRPQESKLRSPALQSSALPTELMPAVVSTKFLINLLCGFASGQQKARYQLITRLPVVISNALNGFTEKLLKAFP